MDAPFLPVADAQVAAAAPAPFRFSTGAAPLLAVLASTAGPPLMLNRNNNPIHTSITGSDLSDMTRELWGVPEAWRELAQNLTDAVVRAAHPAPDAVEWTTEATPHGARFLLNGAYGGEWAVERDAANDVVRALFYNRGRAMPPDAFLTGYTDKNKADARRLQLAGGFGSGMKDGMCALLRDGATAVYVYTFSPGSEAPRKRYFLKVPVVMEVGDDDSPFRHANRPLKLYIADSHPGAPLAVKAVFNAVKGAAPAAGTVVVAEYKGAPEAVVSRLRAAAAEHVVMHPLPDGVVRVRGAVQLTSGAGAAASQCVLLLVPLGADGAGARFFLSPGLKYASDAAEAGADTRFDVIVPGHAVALNRDRAAEWPDVESSYARVVLCFARNEWAAHPASALPPPHDKAAMLAALPPVNRSVAAAVWRVLDGAPMNTTVSALSRAGFVDAAAEHVGAVLFGHYLPVESADDFGTASALYASHQANAALLAAAPAPSWLIAHPLRVPLKLMGLLSPAGHRSVETCRLQFLKQLTIAQDARAVADAPLGDAEVMGVSKWTQWPPLEDAAAWAAVRALAVGVALPRVYALPAPAFLVKGPFEKLDGDALVFAESTAPSFREVVAHICTFSKELLALSVDKLLLTVAPQQQQRQPAWLDGDNDNAGAAGRGGEDDAPAEDTAQPPTRKRAKRTAGDDDDDGGAAAGTDIVYDDTGDEGDGGGLTSESCDDGDDGDDSYDEGDDDDFVEEVGQKRGRNKAGRAPRWLAPAAALAALLERTEAACVGDGAGAAPGEVPFVKACVSPTAESCVCGKVPPLEPRAASLLPGNPARVIYAQPGTVSVDELLDVYGVVLDENGMDAASTYLTAVRDALRRMLLGSKKASAAAMAACALELRVAVAPLDAFVVGNVKGCLYVNLAHLAEMKQSLMTLLVPLAHAVAHNRGPTHDGRSRAHEAYLLKRLTEDAEVCAAHEALDAIA